MLLLCFLIYYTTWKYRVLFYNIRRIFLWKKIVGTLSIHLNHIMFSIYHITWRYRVDFSKILWIVYGSTKFPDFCKNPPNSNMLKMLTFSCAYLPNFVLPQRVWWNLLNHLQYNLLYYPWCILLEWFFHIYLTPVLLVVQFFIIWKWKTCRIGFCTFSSCALFDGLFSNICYRLSLLWCE